MFGWNLLLVLTKLLQEVSLRVLQFSPSSKTNISNIALRPAYQLPRIATASRYLSLLSEFSSLLVYS